jgi:hypothetical protein
MAFIQLDAGQSGCGATYRLTLGLSVPWLASMVALLHRLIEAEGHRNLRWASPSSRTGCRSPQRVEHQPPLSRIRSRKGTH